VARAMLLVVKQPDLGTRADLLADPGRRDSLGGAAVGSIGWCSA